MLFGRLFILTTDLIFGAIALLTGTVGLRLFHSGRAQRVMNRISALIFPASPDTW
ncbi:hypothetical protein [Pelobacter seleniigenes]|uniref:hypothetical protein n=1 Tax=Pelobacter seleniigenes TaxID=407188 RepID=UPI000B0C250C|nr:hypothetical protein [Pelobacter seleniigenes]